MYMNLSTCCLTLAASVVTIYTHVLVCDTVDALDGSNVDSIWPFAHVTTACGRSFVPSRLKLYTLRLRGDSHCSCRDEGSSSQQTGCVPSRQGQQEQQLLVPC